MTLEKVNAWKSIVVSLILALLALGQPAAGQLEVVADKDGSYSVLVGGKPWLQSAATFFRHGGKTYSSDDGSLKMSATPTTAQGADAFGDWEMVNYTYLMSQQAKRVDASIRTYKDLPVVVFSQHFRDELINTSMGDANKVISGFPSFQVGTSTQELGFLLYAKLFIGWIGLTMNRWRSGLGKLSDGLDSGPILLFDKTGQVLIISPFSRFMAASFWHADQLNSIHWGIMGEVPSVPGGYQYDTIIYYGNQGINRAMQEWGELMRRWYRRDTAAREMDLSVQYLGYYTDNGGYYYHYTEPGLNYEKTMLGAVAYSRKQDIPYRYVQYDDWFYPITGKGYGATVTWDSMPSIFPHGLRWLYDQLKMPVVAHNRYWSAKTTYAKQNGGKFNFIMYKDVSLPDDPDFWEYLLGTAKEWGLVVYEQDWLNYQIENFPPMYSDLSLGTRWLRQMGDAAYKYGMQVQYCMALPRHLLASLEVPAVSQVRASIDYQLQSNQWQIGVSSMFASAMGLAPFKDNSWSKSVQPGNIYNKTEASPRLQAVVALLSTGPVGPSDRIGYSDPGLLQSLATSDGLLLKPSKPATAIDSQILQSAFGGSVGPQGQVWSTYSDISGFYFGIIFAAELKADYKIGPTQAGFGKEFGDSVVFSHTQGPPKSFTDSAPLTLSGCTYEHFCLYYTAPRLLWRGAEVVLLGELDKVVPMSPKRVTSLSAGSADLQLTLRGAPGELVDFYFMVDSVVSHLHCKISALGTALVSVADRSCQ